MFKKLRSWLYNKKQNKLLTVEAALYIVQEANEALTNALGACHGKMKGLVNETFALLGAITLQFSTDDNSVITIKREMVDLIVKNKIQTNMKQLENGDIIISLTQTQEEKQEEENDKQ